jgi:dihydroorotase
MRCNEKREDICGVKIFMGSSTGNLLVDNPLALDKIFSNSELLIATHCEDEKIIKENFARLKGEKNVLDPSDHPVIRNEDACFESSFRAIHTQKTWQPVTHPAYQHRKELQLFTNLLPLKEKK